MLVLIGLLFLAGNALGLTLSNTLEFEQMIASVYAMIRDRYHSISGRSRLSILIGLMGQYAVRI